MLIPTESTPRSKTINQSLMLSQDTLSIESEIERTPTLQKVLKADVSFITEDESFLRKGFADLGARLSFISIEKAIQSFKIKQPALILVSYNLVNIFGMYLDDIKMYANKNGIPLLLYSPAFEKIARNIAVTYHFDDYYFGSFSENFYKRISFYRKLKHYKIKHHGKFVSQYQRNRIAGVFLLKRAMDVTASTILLLLLSPVFLIIAILIKLESKGPVFYVSKRAGNGYHV